MAFVFIFAVLSGFVELASMHLIIFHAYLKFKGISTYEFIQTRQSRKIFAAEPGSFPTDNDNSNLEGQAPSTGANTG